MLPLSDLIDLAKPAWPRVQQWIAKARVSVEVLPPSPDRDAALLEMQVATNIPTGAIVYETGGLLVDDGWLRIPGSGHPRLTRTLGGWNKGRAPGRGFRLLADDVVGGFYALNNGGALGEDLGTVHYLGPDSLEWRSTGFNPTDFYKMIFVGGLAEMSRHLRWIGWQDMARPLSGDRCFMFYPPLWSREGSLTTSSRRDIPVAEQWGLTMEYRRQMGI